MTPMHCVKSTRIRSFSGLYFPAFGLNTRKYGPEKLRIRTLFTQSNLNDTDDVIAKSCDFGDLYIPKP